ncbi:PHP domain-containing protein [Rhodococcus spongiicola]|uniref:PHP domain-containing protein n=1 Tax=Rhodococcus spongiicola TaxID=2487352 RepID=A0A438B545_9NOCA|nr:PHP domain-containing protein [Rhodococcus spongiicola]RVW06092.1 PHP domain-containing protein [Rhodococcus spongiicola]
MRIDLHTHSTASDGTDSPTELVQAAVRADVDVLAITDHDTTAGWAEAAAALPSGLRLVRGMEMSCEGRDEDGRPVAVHLLAYLFDPTAREFANERERLRGERVARLRAMATKMAADGLPIDFDAVMADAGQVVGRPHLARALVEAGVVSSVDEAFAGPLSVRSPYYVEKEDTPLERAVEMVNAAGGVSVIAHARARSRGRLVALDSIRELADRGLAGLEVDHPDHGGSDVDLLRSLATELDLIVTGSSDYHGTNKTIELGQYTTAPESFDAIVARASGVPVLSAPPGDAMTVEDGTAVEDGTTQEATGDLRRIR